MKVSILIPLYNSEKFIAETIECALNQTWQDKEIIVVDDGSTDNSFLIAKSYESEILKVYTQQNKGASAARNHAFSKSTGDLIQYLDADDLLSPNKIEEQVKIYLKDSNCDCIISSNIIYFNGNTITGLEFPRCQLITTDYSPGVELLIDIFDYLIGTQTSMWLVPRTIIEKTGGWNEELPQNPIDDGEFFFRAISKCKIVYYCATAIVYYRMPIYGLSKRRNRQAAESTLASARIMKNIILSYSGSKRARKACAKFYYRLYKQFDDEGYFDQMAEKDIKELGFNIETLLKSRRYKLYFFLLGKKLYNKFFVRN